MNVTPNRADAPRRAPFAALALVLALTGTAGARAQGGAAPEVFREDFREVPAHIPARADDLSCAFLGFEASGPGAARVKLSFHPDTPNDPHYLWNGECAGPLLLAFPFAHPLDLSAEDRAVRLRTKNVGGAALHVAVRSAGRWFVMAEPVPQHDDWTVDDVALRGVRFRRLDAERARVQRRAGEPDWRDVDALGFVAPAAGGGSARCIRLDWFSLRSSSARRDPAAVAGRKVRYEAASARPGPEGDGPRFVEDDAPFFRSAVLAGPPSSPNRTRRGVLVRCGRGVWACFDADLLRWAAVWRTPDGRSQPITLDGMAATSFPDRKAKAVREPRIVGDLLVRVAEAPGASAGPAPASDPREARVREGAAVGALPRAFGRFDGVELCGAVPVVRYTVGGVAVREAVTAPHPERVERSLELGATDAPLALRLCMERGSVRGAVATFDGAPLSLVAVHGDGVTLRSSADVGTWLLVEPGPARTVLVSYGNGGISRTRGEVPSSSAAAYPRGRPVVVASPRDGERQGPLRVRELGLPDSGRGERVVRPTDLAFLADGTALVTTFDGDVWRVTGLDRRRATWRRCAAGLYEPTNVAVAPDDRVYVLGRDQVTELVDVDGDGVFDRYDNAADGFLQTLHTRDYALSMERAPDGAFLIAKGGIDGGSQRFVENGAHRGAIVRVAEDGEVAVLADGLRMPYVGLRDDGAVFASDQQGHWIPSTPVHRIGDDVPSYGFVPTRHRGGEQVAPPLLWFPYQSNRSGAGFVTVDARAFPALPDRFVHVAWDGRLFVIATPDDGAPFGWRLPLQFTFPSLNGSNDPVTGTHYSIGLGISGYQPMTARLAGLAAVRQEGAMLAPRRFDVASDRVVVTFADPVPPGVEVRVASLRFWNLRRSSGYGSGHYRWDGESGEHELRPTAVQFDDARRRLELTIPPAYRSSIVALHLQVQPPGEQDYALELFARPAQLPAPTEAQLAALREGPAPQLAAGDPKAGAKLFARYACAGCHSLSGQKLVGPPLDGIGERRADGLDAHLRESILEPQKVVTKGYPPSMPSFAGVIPPQDVEHLVAYLKTL